MQTSVATLSYMLGNLTISSVETRSGDRVISHEVSLPAGSAGQISAAGVDNLPTGHGLAVADVIDVHWTDPTDGSQKVRRGLTIDTANANDVEFDETPPGEGDALPSVGTAVVVAKQVNVAPLSVTGDLVVMIAVKTTQQAAVDIRSATASLQFTKHAQDSSWAWIKDRGDANPFASETITVIRASNGSEIDASLQVGIHHD